MVTLGSDERLQKVVTSVTEEEKRHRQRLLAAMVGPTVVIAVFGIASFFQSRANGETLENTNVVAGYVRNCIQHPEQLTAEERKEQCGGDGSSRAITSLIEFQKCALLIPPLARTVENMNACVNQALVFLEPPPTEIQPGDRRE